MDRPAWSICCVKEDYRALHRSQRRVVCDQRADRSSLGRDTSVSGQEVENTDAYILLLLQARHVAPRGEDGKIPERVGEWIGRYTKTRLAPYPELPQEVAVVIGSFWS